MGYVDLPDPKTGQIRRSIGVTIGGRSPHPHVPWLTLPPSFTPYVPPGNAGSPYTLGIATERPDNPPAGGPSFPFHANVLRHWPSVPPVIPNPNYIVVIPSTVPVDPATGGPQMATPVAASFPGLTTNGAATNYTWQQWAASVQATFGKYTNVATANVTATYGGAVFSTTVGPAAGYGRSEGAAAAAIPATNFIWDVTLGGPTGNGFNEIILTDQFFNGVGFASMLMDPSNGKIIECDVIFDVGTTTASVPVGLASGTNGLFQQFTPPGGQPSTTVPEEWTALEHEIGHFWGLDHTNLHSGVASVGAGALPVVAYTPVSVLAPAFPAASRAQFPVGTATTPTNGPVFPAMVGFITHCGLGVQRVKQALHNDDAVGLSMIYPVPMPRRGSAKIPLINVSGSIRGRVTNFNLPSGTFGRNAWVVVDTALDQAGVGYPDSGVMSGTARIVDDAFATMTDPTLPVGSPPQNYYRDDLLGGAAFFPNASALGFGGTGDFSIDGIPTSIASNATLPDPPEYDVVFEDAALLGVQVANQAEWFNGGPPFIYAGNPLDTTAFPPSPVNQHPQTAITFEANMIGIPRPGASSLSLVQGTVIYVTPSDSNDVSNLNAPAAAFITNLTGLVGAPPRAREGAVRPLVFITPRGGRFASSNLTITIRNDGPNSAYDLSTRALYINGILSNGLLPALPAVTVIAGPATTTYTIPMTSVVGATPQSTPVSITFMVRAAPIPPATQSVDAYGNPVTSGVGRNDVIL